MLKIILADKNGAWTWSLRGLIWEFICAFRENNNHSKLKAPACTTTFPIGLLLYWKTGGCKLSPQLALSSGNRKSRGPLCKDHRDGSVQDLLQQQPFSWWFSTAAYHTTDAATSPPIRLTEGVLFFFKSQEEAKIRKAALLWLCLSQPTITHSVERHITGLSHRSGSQSQWLLRGISHETIRKTTVRDANFIFIHLISFTQVIFILF